jgi:hypothetical protein
MNLDRIVFPTGLQSNCINLSSPLSAAMVAAMVAATAVKVPTEDVEPEAFAKVALASSHRGEVAAVFAD